ncbi:WD domain, G-beta repeat [Novymonas esmeraldas]|uniref:WD domain, G-beta repeat n=1 Tax=Novymonas esmeraldas TaxID=1808958 RepID=A0AAW0F8E9_9TRYP
MGGTSAAFDFLRCPYRGASDSVNDVDVDPHGGCVYAACSSGDVYVWDIQEQKLNARLCHPQWVNAVRCFPLCNSAASCAAAAPPPPPVVDPSAEPGDGDRDALFADIVVHHTIRWVLTGSEDGVIAVWCPITYRMQTMSRPGGAAITALQLIPEDVSAASSDEEPSLAELRSGRGRYRRTSGELDDGPAICCAASLYDLYVFRVTPASSQLRLLRNVRHHGLITAMTYVAPSTSLATPLLVVGQDEGTLCVWDCSAWVYHDAMPYPTGEADVAADARTCPTTVHEPVYQLGRLAKTFRYNLRRCNPPNDPALLEEEEAAVPTATPSDYLRQMPASVSAAAMDVLDRSSVALPTVARNAWRSPRQATEHDDTPQTWQYDARRVTCLAASRSSASSGSPHSYLYSGHATGEVLLWGSVRQEVPLLLLLKKIILFRPGTWVWGMCAVATLRTSLPAHAENRAGGRGAAMATARLAKSKSRRGVARAIAAAALASSPPPRAGAATSLTTTHVSPLELIMWSDGGAVEYVSTRKHHVVHRPGPGFVSSAACAWCGPAMAPPFATRLFLIMVGFDGRVERFDVSEVLELVKGSGKVL